jgi:hypothetical protein
MFLPSLGRPCLCGMRTSRVGRSRKAIPFFDAFLPSSQACRCFSERGAGNLEMQYTEVARLVVVSLHVVAAGSTLRTGKAPRPSHGCLPFQPSRLLRPVLRPSGRKPARSCPSCRVAFVLPVEWRVRSCCSRDRCKFVFTLISRSTIGSKSFNEPFMKG